MSIPGTTEWLREVAQTHPELSEGMLRAANRIERLQGGISKAKTGVDQTLRPAIPDRSRPGEIAALKKPVLFRLPEDDDEVEERVFAWISEVANGDEDTLGPCALFVGERIAKGTYPVAMQLIDIEIGQGYYGDVAVFGSGGFLVLPDCRFEKKIEDTSGVSLLLVSRDVEVHDG